MTLRQEKASSGKPWRRSRRGRGVLGSGLDSRMWKVRVFVGMKRVVIPSGRGRGVVIFLLFLLFSLFEAWFWLIGGIRVRV